MGALEIIIGIVLILLAIVVILVVMAQEGKEAGMGVISGGESFFDKGRAKDMNSFLAKWTKWIAAIFFVLVLAASLICNL